jgi:hypothetical protein
MTGKSTANRQTKNKPTRVPVSGLRDILAVYGKDPSKEYRFVKDSNDGGMRIHTFIRGGWTFTEGGEHSDIVVGDECVYKSEKGHGSIIRYPADGTNYLYLMEIPKELYQEDQEAKQGHIDEVEANITGKRSSEDNELGQYGSIKISRD